MIPGTQYFFALALLFISSKNQLSPINIGITQINGVVRLQIRHAIKFFTPPAPDQCDGRVHNTCLCKHVTVDLSATIKQLTF